MQTQSSFHVRTPIPNNQKINGETRGRSLEKKMLEAFGSNPEWIFAEYDFDSDDVLFTSVRRALSNLKKRKLITACLPHEKIMGKRGVSITTYKLAKQQPNEQEFEWKN